MGHRWCCCRRVFPTEKKVSQEVTYVGKLYAVQLEDEEPMMVAECIIGVDEKYGLVQADSRAALMNGDYTPIPPKVHGRKCVRLWYERHRKDYPNDRFWYHDLDDTKVYFASALDTDTQINDLNGQGTPQAVLVGTDVEICPDTPGNFLCG